MTKRILLINEDLSAQDKIKKDLSSGYTEIVCARSIREALLIFLGQEFALVILDASLSECDGYRLLEVMQTVKPIPVLVLSTKRDRVTGAAASTENEDAVCKEKNYSLRDSLKLAQQAICSCADGVCSDTYHYALVCGKDLIINPDKREVLLKGQSLGLTKTEFDILLCMAKHPGQILSREQIYSHVWNEDTTFNVDDVVKAHIKSIRKKLSAAGTQYIQTVRGVGYRFQID